MNKQQNPSDKGARQPNDPGKIDPTKQDERDNDATRIRPAQEKTPEPETVPGSGKAPGNKGIAETPVGQNYNREPKHKPEPAVEPGKQQGSAINKGDQNPATPSIEKTETANDDEGKPVMRTFGKGL